MSSTNPDVTFKKIDNGFTVTNNLIELIKPYKRFLIRSNSSYYSIANNTLTQLEATELTSELFKTSGVESIPSLSLLNTLTNPEILFWTNVYTTGATLTIKGIPPLP